jgi:proteasome alpha subunit
VGLKSSEGAIISGVEIENNPLAYDRNSKKIYKLDEHIGVAISGLSPDARVLIRQSRLICQVNRLTYEEPVDLETLTGDIGDLYQTYTQNAGVRPFGVSMIIGGVDVKGPRIISIDPSGSYRLYKANSIGRNSEQIKQKLDELYRDNLSLDEGKAIVIEALRASSKEELKIENIKMAEIPTETKRFRNISIKEIAKYF